MTSHLGAFAVSVIERERTSFCTESVSQKEYLPHYAMKPVVLWVTFLSLSWVKSTYWILYASPLTRTASHLTEGCLL